MYQRVRLIGAAEAKGQLELSAELLPIGQVTGHRDSEGLDHQHGWQLHSVEEHLHQRHHPASQNNSRYISVWCVQRTCFASGAACGKQGSCMNKTHPIKPHFLGIEQ